MLCIPISENEQNKFTLSDANINLFDIVLMIYDVAIAHFLQLFSVLW